MKGFRFLILGEKGPENHGIILSQITNNTWLCTFQRQPPVSRVCGVDEIQGWNLFPTDDAMNAFIAEVAKQKSPAPPGPPAGELEIGKATNGPVEKEKANDT